MADLVNSQSVHKLKDNIFKPTRKVLTRSSLCSQLTDKRRIIWHSGESLTSAPRSTRPKSVQGIHRKGVQDHR